MNPIDTGRLQEWAIDMARHVAKLSKAGIPVIALTAHTMAHHQERIAAAGCDDGGGAAGPVDGAPSDAAPADLRSVSLRADGLDSAHYAGRQHSKRGCYRNTRP